MEFMKQQNAFWPSSEKVRFIKILSLIILLSDTQFHRETTLRTPRELPETAKTEKVRFVKIVPKSPFVFSNMNGDFLCNILRIS